MAIRKQIDFNTGYTADYIRISNVYFVNGQSQCVVTVQVWKDQDTRVEMNYGKKPVEEYNVTITLDSSNDPLLKKCYNALKQLSDFSGSEDI